MEDSDDYRFNTLAIQEPSSASSEVGYGKPPVHSRFQPGQSGNPAGRAKGSRNLKTIFNKILNEEVSVREGTDVRQVSKIEAVLRRVVVDALKGDQRSMATMFRLAEATGHFEDQGNPITAIRTIVVNWKAPGAETDPGIPPISDISRDEP